MEKLLNQNEKLVELRKEKEVEATTLRHMLEGQACLRIGLRGVGRCSSQRSGVANERDEKFDTEVE